MAVKEMIGFDLGHGEFALARASLQAGTEVTPLKVNQRTSQITALGRAQAEGSSTSDVLVGERAFLRFKSLSHFVIGFKGKPREDQEYRQTMKDFVLKVYETLVHDKQIIGGDSSHFIVGCPSEWSLQERTQYEQALKASGIPKLTVVAESSAAMLNAKESGQIQSEGMTALVIDVGSSTTDFTFFSGHIYEKPLLEYGDDKLGAGSIDEAIYLYVIKNHEQRNILQKFIESETRYNHLWLYICRKIKEEFFSHREDYTEPGVYIDIGRLGVHKHEDFEFAPLIDGPTMLKILDQPLPRRNLSWAKAFRSLLRKVRVQIYEHQHAAVDLIILAGGGSQMYFIEETVKAVFPEAHLTKESQRELSVAKGLAYWGRWDHLSEEFRGEVRDFCNTKVTEILQASKNNLVASIVPNLVNGLIKDVVEPKMKEWRNGQIDTINDLESCIRDVGKAYIEMGTGKVMVLNQIKEWFIPIGVEVNRITDNISHKYRIPTGSLNIKPQIPIEGGRISVITIELPKIIQDMLDVAGIISAIVIACLLGGGGTALLFSGPIGWIIGIAIGIAAVSVGREKAEEIIRNKSLPTFVKKTMISEGKISQECWKEDLVQGFKVRTEEAISRDDTFGSAMQRIASQIQEQLGILADKAKWQIR